MKDPSIKIFYARFMTIMIVIGLLLLIVMQSLWVFAGSETSIIQQVNLQQARAETIAKDICIISSNHTGINTTNLTELQTNLVLFKKAQNGIIHGDSDLGLPSTISGTVQQSIELTNDDYLSLTSIADSIVANPNTPILSSDTLIAVNSSRSYVKEMSNAALIYKHQIDVGFYMLFYVEAFLTIVVLTLSILKYFFVTNSLIRFIMEQKA